MFDKIIIGAGLYGLYAAELCARHGQQVLVLEHDSTAFSRATYINQARVHMGYHYPRSYSTAIKSAGYFNRFVKDYEFCILSEFDQIYATSNEYSWTNADQFNEFCKNAEIKCDYISPEKYFNYNMCDGAFITTEYTYDAKMLCNYLLEKIDSYKNVTILYNTQIDKINKHTNSYEIVLQNGKTYSTPFLLNASYASTNQIISLLGHESFNIKYELCEIILCKVEHPLENTGITVMDGPFFSIMPFGKTGFHSLTSVTFTPHTTSYNPLPTFDCQQSSMGFCSPNQLGNCNNCIAKPNTAWPYMSKMAQQYLRPEYKFTYDKSLFSMKPILKASEIDDSRPTLIRTFTESPTFISVLSGKINTVYDLDSILLEGK